MQSSKPYIKSLHGLKAPVLLRVDPLNVHSRSLPVPVNKRCTTYDALLPIIYNIMTDLIYPLPFQCSLLYCSPTPHHSLLPPIIHSTETAPTSNQPSCPPATLNGSELCCLFLYYPVSVVDYLYRLFTITLIKIKHHFFSSMKPVKLLTIAYHHHYDTSFLWGSRAGAPPPHPLPMIFLPPLPTRGIQLIIHNYLQHIASQLLTILTNFQVSVVIYVAYSFCDCSMSIYIATHKFSLFILHLLTTIVTNYNYSVSFQIYIYTLKFREKVSEY